MAPLRLRFLCVVILVVAWPLAATTTTSITSVTPLAHNQVRVCWKSAPDAVMYWIEGSKGIEDTVVRDSSSGIVCRNVNLFGVAACQVAEITVRVATVQNGQEIFGNPSPHFHFVNSGAYVSGPNVADDFFSAPAICSPASRYPTIDAAVSQAPSQLTLTDMTTPRDPTPRIRLSVQCDPKKKENLVRFEIYENTLKPDGSTTTRTSKSETCPKELALTGSWGDRSTITVASIFKDLDTPNTFNHSICTEPRAITYGGALVAAPRVLIKTGADSRPSLAGSTESGEVLFFVNPTDGYQLTKPTGTAYGKTFEVPVDLNRGLNRIYAVSRQTISGKTVYSEPSELFIQWRPDGKTALTLNDLGSFVLFDHFYLTGSGPADAPISVILTRDGKQVTESSLVSCPTGEFGSQFYLGNLPVGKYMLTLSTTATGEAQSATTVLHLNEIHPAPAVSLFQGHGPFQVKGETAELRGRITPYVDTEVNITEKGHSLVPLSRNAYELRAIVNGQPLDTKVEDSDRFTVNASALHPGMNVVTLHAVFVPTGQESEAMEVHITRGDQPAKSGSIMTPVDLERANELMDELIKHYQADEWKEVISVSDKLLKVNPRSPATYADRAAAYIKLGNEQAAFDNASRALDLDERDFRAHAYRTNYLFNQRKYAESMDDLNRAIELDSTFSMPWQSRAMARLQLGKYAAAIADATKGIELTPNDSYSYRVRARAYDQLGRQGDALVDLAKAMSIDPNSFRLLSTRGEIYEHMRDYDRAIADYTKLISVDAEDAASHYNSRAWAEYQKGDLDMAIADATQSITLSATPYAYGTRAWARRAKGDQSGALDDLNKAAALNPNYEGMDTDRGLAEYIRGNYRGAVELWEKQLEASNADRNAITPMLEDARKKASGVH